jgi:CRISPR-associated exonuclease Cas4
MSNERIAPLMQVVAKGLRNPKAKTPKDLFDKSLGDRSSYIGASSATGCMRKAYLDVKEITEHSDKQIFVFERGHQLEEMVRKGLNGAGYTEYATVEDAKGLNLIHQLEVQGKGKFDFIKGHLDFVFVKQKEKELVIQEMKSSAVIPNSPYDSHIRQLTLQIWLLRQQFPDYSVRGAIVYHNWDSGESEEYKVEYSRPLLVAIVKRALLLWNSISQNREPAPEIQMYCDKCAYKANCPALEFGGKLPRELEEQIEKVKEAKAAEKEVKKIKANFKAMLEASGLKGAKVGDTTVSIVNVNGKKAVPVSKLKKEHRAIYEQLAEESGGYSFLKIT